MEEEASKGGLNPNSDLAQSKFLHHLIIDHPVDANHAKKQVISLLDEDEDLKVPVYSPTLAGGDSFVSIPFGYRKGDINAELEPFLIFGSEAFLFYDKDDWVVPYRPRKQKFKQFFAASRFWQEGTIPDRHS